MVGLTATAAMAAPTPSNQAFPGSVPGWATAANDLGTAADTSVEGEVFLSLRNVDAAIATATAVSTPGSGSYKQPLSPQQWIQRFSPTQADVDAVVAHLKAKGMTITDVPASRQFVVFRGPAGRMGSAFGTELHLYSHGGASLLAPAAPPSLPAALAAKVQGISIDQSRLLTRPDLVKQDEPSANRFAAAAPVLATPCSNYWDQNTVTVPPAYAGNTRYGTYICGYKPAQLQSAYGVADYAKAGIDGRGQTVAIIDAYASPTIVEDVNTFSSAAGLPVLDGSTYEQIVPAPSEFTDQAICQEPSGWQTEQTLDVEAVHGLAPGAKVLYVGGTNCNAGLDVAMATILDGGLANIVSNSYGNVGEDVSADVLAGEVNEHIQAAAEGIGLYFSSGDNGDERAKLGYTSPDFPASSPWVTAVGGTSLAVGQNGNYLFEAGWGSSLQGIVKDSAGNLSYAGPLPGTFRFGAGGGRSAVFDQPAYQRGAVPDALANGHRVSPDVAAVADPYTGYQTGFRPIIDDTTLATGPYENVTVGGTSLASPVTAAQMAIAQQLTHSTVGFANPTVYLLARYASFLFRDVQPQTPRQALAFTRPSTGLSYLISTDTDTSLTTAAGYDDVTGVGSVSLNLATLLARQGG
ncbi:S53 family serine peptidase [Paenarthrobacter sp. PH39-S1]|uniref:S53 family peptidase n=1 Tax=Paenarthrobacter sp. PH39-S1 TaxID=3046204 RepID=UPI0024BB03D5|nr:S53 family serine peptidase [Paenarthrobacter sp. PH39-S1]MDJ0354904.1 S53 family serine peptidase [Paenarthrobacter sp. PH39-S1]